MIKGVNEKEEKIIRDILKKYPYEFFCYGSRVKGDYTAGRRNGNFMVCIQELHIAQGDHAARGHGENLAGCIQWLRLAGRDCTAGQYNGNWRICISELYVAGGNRAA